MTTDARVEQRGPAAEQEDSAAAGRAYRFEDLTMGMVMQDMRYGNDDLGPGDRVPEFDLVTVDGGRFQSTGLGPLPVLMVFGSRTCPVTESAGPQLKALHEQYGSRIRFVLVNTREAHPGELIPQPQTSDDKMEHARELQRHHGITFEVAVDDLDGTLHRAFSPKPNSAYLIDPNGTILFRAHWANDRRSLEPALAAAAEGRAPKRGRSRGMVRSMMKAIGHVPEVVDDAGRKAGRDMWRIATPLALLGRVSRLFRSVPIDARGWAAVALLGVLSAIVVLASVVIS